VPLLDHHLQKFKITPSSTQITSWYIKKTENNDEAARMMWCADRSTVRK